MTRISDERLKTLGQIYCSNAALRRSGYTFNQFVHYPDELLRLAVFNAGEPDAETPCDEPLPLLPAQAAAAARIADGYVIQAAAFSAARGAA